jgi:hypothetical protein
MWPTFDRIVSRYAFPQMQAGRDEWIFKLWHLVRAPFDAGDWTTH